MDLDLYTGGDVVWVKMGNCWWPGEVCSESQMPQGLLASMKGRPPIAVVRFFQEKTFEYVKNLNNIYKYNCAKKKEFIKKGLDMYRSKKQHMEKFPADVQLAENLTGGDPKIIDSEEFAPEVRKKWSDLFEDSSAKKGKGKAGRSPAKTKTSPIVDTPRPITHPRFIRKAIDGTTDHEVRILAQPSTSYSTPTSSGAHRNSFSGGNAYTPPNPQNYKCHLCNFSSARLNVVILHSKSHSNEPIPQQKGKKTPVVVTPKPKLAPKATVTTPARATAKKQTAAMSEIVDTPKAHKTLTAKAISAESKPASAKKSAAKQRASKRNTMVRAVDKASEDDGHSDIKKTNEPSVQNSVKPEEKLKSSLLADWSEDESDVYGFETDVTTNVQIINMSSKSPGTSAATSALRVEKELPNIQSVLPDKPEVLGISEKSGTTPDSAPIMKYRNIPKKSRYLFSENLDDMVETVTAPKEEETDKKKELEIEEAKDKSATTDATDCAKAVSTKGRILSRASRRRTESVKQTTVVPKEEMPEDVDKPEGAPEAEDKPEVAPEAEDVKPDIVEEMPPTISEKETEPEEIKEEVAPTEPIKMETEVNAEVTAPTAMDGVEETKEEKESPKRETSCFDFAEDDEEMPVKSPPTRRRSRKSIPLVDPPAKVDEPKSVEPMDTAEVAVEKHVDEIAEEPPEVPSANAEKEKDDELLQSEVVWLLKETEVPHIPADVVGNNDVSSTSIDIKERKLPPKERGKRIFKSRNSKHETATTSATGIDSAPAVVAASLDLKAPEEPVAASAPANEKAAEVDSPKSVADKSPVDDSNELSICKISTTPTEADLQVAEALIALPQIRDNRAEATERRTSSRRENRRQQMVDMAAAAVECQKRRDIEEKVEAAEFLVGLSMSTGTSPITESVSQNIVENVALSEPETPTSVGNKRAPRKRPLKTEERLTPDLGRTRAKKNKLDDVILFEDEPIDEKDGREEKKKRSDDRPRGKKRTEDDDWFPEANTSSSKSAKRRLLDPNEAVASKDDKLSPTTANHSQKSTSSEVKIVKKPEEMAVDMEDEIPLPFVIEKMTAVSKVELVPVTSPVNSTPLKGSSKRKSKREPTTKSPLVVKPQPAPEPKKDDSIFDINNMPIVLSDVPITSDAILIDDDTPSTSKCDTNVIVISPEKPVDAPSKESIRNSISPTNSKPSLKTIKLKASDTQKIKELQQKSNMQLAHSPPIGVSTTKASLIKSQIILPACGSPGSPGAISASPALLSRSSISSPSASEDETQMHVSTKRFPKGKSALVQEEIKLTPATQVVLPKSPLVKSTTSAPVGGQLIITSKGTLITTQSSPAISMSSLTASDTSTTLVSSSGPATSLISSTTISSSSKFTSKNKKSTKSIVEPQIYPSSKTAVAANASKILQQKALTPDPTPVQVSSMVARGPPAGAVLEKSTNAKREVVRMSAQKLAEMTRLGFIEEKPHGKVLTPSGVRRMQEQKLLAMKPVTTTAVIVPPLASPSLIVVEPKCGQKVTTTPSTNDRELTVTSPPVDKKEPSLQSPMLANSDVEDVDKTSCDMIEEDVASTSNSAVTDDSQIAAISAENFGGPANAFYLCAVGENGSLKPMKDKIYILDGVTSRLIAVDNVDEPSADAQNVEEVITVPGDRHVVTETTIQQEDVIEIPEEVADEDGEEPAIVCGDPENPSILINIGDQQIVLDQQTLLTLASGGEMPQLLNQDGQPLLLQDYAQEILAALAMNQAEPGAVNISDDGAEQQIILADDLTGVVDNQVLATREQLLVTVGGLDNLVVENQSPNLIDIIDPSINFQSMNPQAHTSETSATQGVIMSTIEAPTSTKTNGIGCLTTSSSSPVKISASLDESLAQVLGPIASNPIQLVLPITITNPDIAPKVAKNFNPLQIYPNSVLPIGLVTSATVALPFDTAEPASVGASVVADEKENSSSAGNNNNYNDLEDEIIPGSGSASPTSMSPGHNARGHDEDDESTNSSEIPIQPNLVFREDHLILNDGATGDDEFSDAEPVNESNFSLNGSNNSNLIGNPR